ncbi:MAG TPA: PH domain-containing protein [Aldersonia sp.]
MDNPRLEWATPLGPLVAVAVGGVCLAVAAVAVGNEPAGRLLIGVAAVGLLVIAVLGFVQRPRLAIVVGPQPALAIRRLRGTTVHRRADLERVRVVRYPRLGRRVPMLEIDARTGDGDTRLAIFSRWDLGTNPESVFETLADHGLVPG